MKAPIVLFSIAMAGGLMAQKPVPVPSRSNNKTAPAHPAAVSRSDRRVQRLAKRLDLTADQQTRVKAIFADSKQQVKALAPRLREERAALRAAVRSDSES